MLAREESSRVWDDLGGKRWLRVLGAPRAIFPRSLIAPLPEGVGLGSPECCNYFPAQVRSSSVLFQNWQDSERRLFPRV